ncbi:hypothetical protein [Lacticaseibacillus manihotivorans]|uniref:Membrane protein 6-pyruvoyl-tetrahydropterin synthase-related domain-containing protein n=3 Tax=Lacticaseibacillus manihotivorans TaxID=88233 RepID=A0A0R1QLP0_9LACO|nr:hypothetical protein [Lacticaseibacillus manihotivorans]KRL41576.1 hypothetical protein FD01_GL002159 [Lacticaseibacillus manihotivorans DSM 13343 = JCM 12514]QFQ92798.1 hypothetical protein LM010_15985 [Lacticaseibacillus manihotivorans]
MTSKKQTYFHLLILLGIAVVICLPFLTMGKIYNQDDFLFHKARMLAYYTSVMKDHDFLPRVLPSMAGGFGYAVDIFYNSFTLLPFVLFKAVLGGFVLPYNLYLLTLTITTSLMAYGCARKVFKPQQALLGAVLYATNTYRLIDLFVRGDIGESLAIMLLPLVVLGFYRSLQPESHWRTLAIGMTLLFIAHPLSAGIVTILMICFDAYRAITHQLTKIQFLTQGRAALTAMILTLFLTGPMLEQAAYQKLQLSRAPALWPVGLNFSLAKLLSNSLSNASGVWAKISPSVGPLALLILIFALFQFKTSSKSDRQLTAVTWLIFILSSNLMLWPIVQHSFLATLQFEWRLLMVAALLSAMLAMRLIHHHHIALIAFATLLALSFNYAVVNSLKAQDSILVVNNKNANTANNAIGGTYDYLPTSVSPTIATDPHRSTFAKAESGITLAGFGTRTGQQSNGAETYEIASTSKQSGIILLPKIAYKGYTVSSTNKTYQVQNVNGLLGVKVGRSHPSALTVQYTGTWIQHLTTLISLIFALGLLWTWWRLKHHPRQPFIKSKLNQSPPGRFANHKTPKIKPYTTTQ